MAIDVGCKYQKFIQFKDRSTGQPIDVSTWQFESTLRDEAGEAVLDLSTGGGHFTVTDGPNGWLRFALSEAETGQLSPGKVTGVLYRTDDGRSRYGQYEDIVRPAE